MVFSRILRGLGIGDTPPGSQRKKPPAEGVRKVDPSDAKRRRRILRRSESPECERCFSIVRMAAHKARLKVEEPKCLACQVRVNGAAVKAAEAAETGEGANLSGAPRPSLSKRTNSTSNADELTPYQHRQRFALAQNVQRSAERAPKRAYFVTLTCGFWKQGKFVKFRHPKSVSKRWNSLNRHFQEWCGSVRMIRVPELHKDGTWHLHLYVETDDELSNDWDWATYDRAREAGGRGNNGMSRALFKHLAQKNPKLGELWALMRAKLPKYGFGRFEFVPVRFPEKAGNYLGKYLGKGVSDRGRVHVRYLGDWRKHEDRKTLGFITPRGWCWLGTIGKAFRQMVAGLASAIGQNPMTFDITKITTVYGKSWCFKLWQAMTTSREMGCGVEGFESIVLGLLHKANRMPTNGLDWIYAQRHWQRCLTLLDMKAAECNT